MPPNNVRKGRTATSWQRGMAKLRKLKKGNSKAEFFLFSRPFFACLLFMAIALTSLLIAHDKSGGHIGARQYAATGLVGEISCNMQMIDAHTYACMHTHTHMPSSRLTFNSVLSRLLLAHYMWCRVAQRGADPRLEKTRTKFTHLLAYWCIQQVWVWIVSSSVST
jgi:hypothetical protein